tara:strand:- start:651 stop:863 length:213 start_codon:yes stop_codon:yes gene_type:complete
MNACTEHKGMAIVHQYLDCPLCRMLGSVDEAGKLTEEALNMVSIEDTAEELSEVAGMLLKGMETLRNAHQ